MSSVSEVWKPVVGHETTHEVSNLGRVRALAGVVVCRNGVRKPRRARVLSGCVNKAIGYKTAGIGGKNRYIHQLVLEAFVGPRPHRHEACHENGNRIDNRLENLRWGSPQSNQMDRAKHGTSNRGERCANARLTAEQAREIIESSEGCMALSRRYGIAPQTVCNIKSGRNWKHLQEAAA